MSTPIMFEGRPVPADLLAALESAQSRPWLVRAAVCHPELAEQIEARCAVVLASVDARPRAVGASVQAAHALMLRRLASTIADGVLQARWTDQADPTQPGRTLMHSALGCLVDISRPDDLRVRGAVRHCLGVPGLRAAAWRATRPSDIDTIIEAVVPLLAEAPALAEEVATRLALLHPERCLDAAERLATADLSTRTAFAGALEKHLKRVFSIKRWVACRRALLGA